MHDNMVARLNDGLYSFQVTNAPANRVWDLNGSSVHLDLPYFISYSIRVSYTIETIAGGNGAYGIAMYYGDGTSYDLYQKPSHDMDGSIDNSGSNVAKTTDFQHTFTFSNGRQILGFAWD